MPSETQDQKAALVRAIEPLYSKTRTDISAVKTAEGGMAWTRDPLTEARLLKHVNGGPYRGVCPILGGQSVTMVAILDLDSHRGETPFAEMRQAALRIIDASAKTGLAPSPWRSSGGNGIHLYYLWDEPQDAYSVRRELTRMLESIGYKAGVAGVSKGEIELFPKQDSVALDKFGNQFILPLAGKSVPLELMLDLEPLERADALTVKWPISKPVPVLVKPVRAPATMSGSHGVGLARLQSAVSFIAEKGIDSYDEWRTVVFGIHAETGGDDDGLEMAIGFAQQVNRYPVEKLTDSVWPYITDRDGGITVRTIFAMAREAGWVEDISAEFDVILPEPDEMRHIPEAHYLTTDLANAHRLKNRSKGELMVVTDQWYVWTGRHWSKDAAAAFCDGCKLSSIIRAEATEWANRRAANREEADRNLKTVEALRKWALKSEMKTTIEAGHSILKRMLTVEDGKLDNDPWLLNCMNGTVDLRTGEIRPHAKTDFISMLLPFEYSPRAACPNFERTVGQIFGNNAPMLSFMQSLLGYCCTGMTREQVLPVHWGAGSNGKSLLLNIVTDILGPYAGSAAPDLLTARTGDRHATEIADLRGKRFVVAHESGESAALREDFIKQATGGDVLKGRFMRGDFFDFQPTHKLAMITNHKPQVRGRDNGIWRRLLLIPYTSRFGEPEEVAAGLAGYVKDEGLAGTLKAEYPGILAWLVKGAVTWARDGLNPPDEVKAATSAYKEEQDRVGQFVTECCVRKADAYVQCGGVFGLYRAYQDWCKDSGYAFLGRGKFQEALTMSVPNGKWERKNIGRGERAVFCGLELVQDEL